MTSYNLSAQVALLTEHFQHTPISLIDEIINTINQILNNGIDNLENYLLSESADRLGFHAKEGTIPETDADGKILLDPDAENEIRTGVHKLETLLENAIDRNFDRFEIYVLRNILTVPEDLVGWIRLAHHKGLDFSPSPPQSSEGNSSGATEHFHPTHPTNETLRVLRQKLIASHYVNQTLKTEVAANNALISRLKAILAQPPTVPPTATDTTDPPSTSTTAQPEEEPLSFLTTQTPNTLLPLSTTTAFVASQISSIRTLLKDIEPKFADLQEKKKQNGDKDEDTTPPDGDPTNDLMDLDPSNTDISPDEKRKRYIEKMIRRHMQKQRRLKLTRRGEVVGGEYWDGVAAGSGSASVGSERRRGLEEVQALEALFGSNATGTSGSGIGDVEKDKEGE